MDFSQKMDRLEEILRLLQGEAMPLEESLELFEEGRGLMDECRDFLQKAEGRVIALDDDGVTEPTEEE